MVIAHRGIIGVPGVVNLLDSVPGPGTGSHQGINNNLGGLVTFHHVLVVELHDLMFFGA
jgi:hypothetical protein